MPTCSTVTYRSFEDRDFDAAAELFFRQWCCGGDERLGRLDAQVNLCTYLMDVTWGVVAEPVPGRGSGEGDGLLGVLLVAAGAADHERRRFWEKRREALLAHVAPGAEFGREVCRVEAEELRLSRGYAADGVNGGSRVGTAEFKLLVVSPAARGLGVGRRLVELGQQAVREAGLSGYYLITDDTCDVGFYDHLGLSRRREEPSQAEPGINLYVYAKELG